MTPERRAWAFLSTIVAVTVLLLAACSSDDGPPPPCPIVVLVKDADRLTRFEGSGRDLTDVVFETTIRNADVACAYEDNEVEAALRVLFATTRGPADSSRRADFRYFVAVADREQNILAREEFDLAAIFPGNRTEILQINDASIRTFIERRRLSSSARFSFWSRRMRPFLRSSDSVNP